MFLVDVTDEQVTDLVTNAVAAFLAEGKPFSSHEVKMMLRRDNANFNFRSEHVYDTVVNMLAPLIQDGVVERTVKDFNGHPVYFYCAVSKGENKKVSSGTDSKLTAYVLSSGRDDSIATLENHLARLLGGQ